MTRRDFEFIAEVLKDCRDHEVIDEGSLDLIVAMFVNRLARTNDNFDAKRFVKATGFEFSPGLEQVL